MMHTNPIEEQLERYMQGKSSADESSLVEQWLHDNVASPEYDALFRRLLEKTPPDTDSESIQRAWRFLERLLDSESKPRRNVIRHTLVRVAAYAAVTAAAVVALTLLFRPSSAIEWCEEYATRGESRQVELPDGSQIWLNSGSRLFYPSRFAGTRNIYVDGEIFADVVKDQKRPFIVSASGVKVRVLGTQFSLKSYAEDDGVEVALMRGSVLLEAGEGAGKVDYILNVGEMVRYHRASGIMDSYSIDTDTYGARHKNRNLYFVNQTLGDIAADLERRFDVHIVIDSPELADAQYYSSFVNHESLEQILNALNGNNTMRIAKINDAFVISRK